MSEHLLGPLIRALPVSVALSRFSDGAIVDVNDAFVALTGFSRNEIVGRTSAELGINRDPEGREHLIQLVQQRGAVYNADVRCFPKTGKPRDVVASLSVVEFEGAKYILSTILDITERKQAEAALLERDELFRLAMNNVASGVYTLDLQGLVTYVNPTAEAMFGWTNAELLGRKMHDVTHYKHPDGSPFPASDCPGLQVLQKGVELRESEDTFIRKGGDFFPVVYSASPLKHESATVGIVVGFRDDTLRREAERTIRESEERFRLMADTAPVMIWTSGEDGLCHYFNRQWLEFTGRPLEAEKGNGWLEGVHPADVEHCRDIYVEAFERREPFRMDYRLRRHDGEYRWVLDSGVPRFAPGGSFSGYIGSAIDVTDHRRAQEALSSLSQRVIQAQEQERAFLARELHDDISQRASTLLLQLQLFARTLPTGTSDQMRVQKMGDQALALAKALPALSHRLHSATAVHLGIAHAAERLCTELADQYNVEIEFTHAGIPEHLSESVAICLFRVLQEALSNAIKHSGTRHFAVALIGSPNEIQLTVIDSGVGFDPKTATGSHGLGFISMKERVSAVRGEVSIESRPGAGTTVLARVPLEEPNVPSAGGL